MFQNMTFMVKRLFYLNILMFLLSPFLENYIKLELYSPTNDLFQPWQLITHMFVHGGVFHILCNMLGLVTIAPMVESSLGSRRFLLYYILCGLFAAFTHIFMTTLSIPIIGASGALYGIFVMFAYLFPNEKLLFFFLIPFKSKYLMAFLFILEVYLGFNSHDHIAHFAHVGGCLGGMFLMLINKYIPTNKYI